jgi:hypothetical protein
MTRIKSSTSHVRPTDATELRVNFVASRCSTHTLGKTRNMESSVVHERGASCHPITVPREEMPKLQSIQGLRRERGPVTETALGKSTHRPNLGIFPYPRSGRPSIMRAALRMGAREQALEARVAELVDAADSDKTT